MTNDQKAVGRHTGGRARTCTHQREDDPDPDDTSGDSEENASTGPHGLIQDAPPSDPTKPEESTPDPPHIDEESESIGEDPLPPLSEYSERELMAAISRASDYVDEEETLSQIMRGFEEHYPATDFPPTAGLHFTLAIAAITGGADERITDETIGEYLPARAHQHVLQAGGILTEVPFSIGALLTVEDRSTGRIGQHRRRLTPDARYHISDAATRALRRLVWQDAYGESVDAVDCNCGQCEAWVQVIEQAERQRVFSFAQYLELAGVMMDLLYEGPRELQVDQYLGRVSDEIESRIRERTEGEAGEWFDESSWLAERDPITFGTDIYRPGLLLKNFDGPPDPASCETLSALLSEEASEEPSAQESPEARSLLARLRAVSAGGPDRRRDGGPDGKRQRAQGNRAPAAGAAGTTTADAAAERTAKNAAKDSTRGGENGEKRDLRRSDGETGPFAVGRDSVPSDVIEADGIRFSSTWTITRRQARMIETAACGLTDATHHFFVHAVRSSQRESKKSEGWFPFHYKHIRRALPVTREEYDKTERVWRPLVERALIEYEKHSHPDGDAREFRVRPNWLLRFSEAALDEVGPGRTSGTDGSGTDGSGGTVDAFTGEVSHQQKAETRLHDANNKPFRGSLLAGLKVLKSSRKRFNKRAVEDWLVHRKREVVEAKMEVGKTETENFKEHKLAYSNVLDGHLEERGWPTGISYERWKMICPEQKYTTEHLRFRTLRKSYINDLRCYAAVMRQKPERVDGEIWEYDTAWRAQVISGRVSEVGGALQSCSRPMKAAAYEGVDVYNYDLKGSQLRDVIEASEMAPNLDTTELRSTYVETSKTENARRLGVSRNTYKRLLYATTFLGSWKTDFWTAINTAKTSRGLPEPVRIIKRAAWEEGIDTNEVYKSAAEHFRPLSQAVQELADFLLTDYWEDKKYNAGGYLMRNDCDVSFRKSDYQTGTDEDGTPTYNTHEIRSKVLAWHLQGSEADKMHRLAAACEKAGIEVLGHEHDGLITVSPIPQGIQDEVLPGSELERKDFQDFAVDTDQTTAADLNDLHAELCTVLQDDGKGHRG